MLYLTQILFFLPPVAALTFFAVSLILYVSAKMRNKRQPGSVKESALKVRKGLLIVASVIVGILLAIVLCLVGLMYMAVAFM